MRPDLVKYWLSLSTLDRLGGKVLGRPLAVPEPPLCSPSLIPPGDQSSSGGQRPRKSCPTRPDPACAGSNPCGVTPALISSLRPDATPSVSGYEPPVFRRRFPRLQSCALAGHNKSTGKLHPAAPLGPEDEVAL